MSVVESRMTNRLKMCAAAALALALGLAGGCSTYRESNTTRTPEEQILLTKAVDRSLADALPAGMGGRRVFLDVTNLDCTDKAYVADAVRQGIASQGARMVEKTGDADTVVTVRAGMLATQSGTTIVGIPCFKVPTLVTSGSLETPEFALYKRATQEGLAKLCVTAYDNDTKELIGGREGTARTRFERWHILFVINYNTTNVPELKIPPSPDK